MVIVRALAPLVRTVSSPMRSIATVLVATTAIWGTLAIVTMIVIVTVVISNIAVV